MVTLIVAPTLYLAVPLFLPIDLTPDGLARAVLPKATSEQGRGFLRHVISELEGAIDRAAESVEASQAHRRADHAEHGAEHGAGSEPGSEPSS